MNKQEIYDYIKQRGQLMFDTQETWVDFEVYESFLAVRLADLQEIEVYAYKNDYDTGLVVRSFMYGRYGKNDVRYFTTESINEIFFAINEIFAIYEDEEFVEIYEQTP